MASFWDKVVEDAREERAVPGIRPAITKGRYILRQLSGTPGDLLSFKEPVTYEEVCVNCSLLGRYGQYDTREEVYFWPEEDEEEEPIRHMDALK